ncbi:hypothetical protein POVWA2_038440 [Plasmodium ovale wallikeri]|uniref:Uncharacterized protein n=1 Tax=Plasmodium ovale wallikeri TaxID=864142 RepID=A0A1A8Z631_PLAOA|nr:hypothetical protein POVWA1_039700 [Plasmodium ovale wallikeri]SBT39804.1 hypothetical protein POVWA2_038440 [Plasmodium ovale wallikeri]
MVYLLNTHIFPYPINTYIRKHLLRTHLKMSGFMVINGVEKTSLSFTALNVISRLRCKNEETRFFFASRKSLQKWLCKLHKGCYK